MKPAFIIFIAWLLFGGSHLLLSGSSLRKGLVEKYGTMKFTLIFMVVTIITLSGLIIAVFVYGHRGVLNYQIEAHPVLLFFLKGVAFSGFLLMVAGLINYPRSPMAKLAIQQKRMRAESVIKLKPATLIERVIRHPFFFGLAVLMAVHAVLAETLAMVVYLLGFVILAAIGIPMQDRKLRQKWDETYQSFEKETSNLPFSTPLHLREITVSKWWKGGVIMAASAIFLSVAHPLLKLANGVVFSVAILVFGLLMVFRAVLSSR